MINLGFIGAGGYGKWHLEGFLPFHRSGRVRICALADVSREALGAAAAIDGLQQARRFTDYEEMLAEGGLDAVVVSAPIPFHEEIALRVAARGLFALLEKPPVPLLSQLDRLVAADTHERVMVAFQHIYSPLLRRMKEIAWSGEIGRPVAVSGVGIWPRDTAYYERAGWAGKIFWKDRATLDGPCTNGMAHFTNSIFFVAGETPTGFSLPRRLEGETYRARAIASYDLGGMRGRLDNGCEFGALFAHASAGTMPVRIRVQGTAGSVEISDNNKQLTDPAGNVTRGSDGRSELMLAFLEFAEGKRESNLTPPAAMRAYVLATNMMFLSSGGIHAIPDRFVTIHRPATPETVYEVAGIELLFERASEQGISLEKADAPWAIRPRGIERSEYDETRLLDVLRRNEAAAAK